MVRGSRTGSGRAAACHPWCLNYLLEPVLSFSFSALGLEEGELGEAPDALLELDGLEGLDGLVAAEPDMLLEPLAGPLGLESLRESVDDEDWDGLDEALLPGLFVRSQAARVSAPAASAMRSLVALRVMWGLLEWTGDSGASIGPQEFLLWISVLSARSVALARQFPGRSPKDAFRSSCVRARAAAPRARRIHKESCACRAGR